MAILRSAVRLGFCLFLGLMLGICTASPTFAQKLSSSPLAVGSYTVWRKYQDKVFDSAEACGKLEWAAGVTSYRSVGEQWNEKVTRICDLQGLGKGGPTIWMVDGVPCPARFRYECTPKPEYLFPADARERKEDDGPTNLEVWCKNVIEQAYVSSAHGDGTSIVFLWIKGVRQEIDLCNCTSTITVDCPGKSPVVIRGILG